MKTPISFVNDGAILRGTLATPDTEPGTSHPLVILSQGLGTLHEWASPTTDALVAGGLACLTFDYRGFGDSDGAPSQEANPWKLVHDLRAAVDLAHTLENIDSERIGLWGSSYGGGISMVAAAIDPRVAALFLQVPLASGTGALRSFAPPEVYASITEALHADRVGIASGTAPVRLTQTTLDPEVPAIAYDEGTFEHMTSEAKRHTPQWRNELTLQTVGLMMEFEPGDYLPRVAPRPVMLVVADDDTICPAPFAMDAYDRLDGPKDVLHILGDHYCVYGDQYDLVSETARDWFSNQLSSQPAYA